MKQRRRRRCAQNQSSERTSNIQSDNKSDNSQDSIEAVALSSSPLVNISNDGQAPTMHDTIQRTVLGTDKDLQMRSDSSCGRTCLESNAMKLAVSTTQAPDILSSKMSPQVS